MARTGGLRYRRLPVGLVSSASAMPTSGCSAENFLRRGFQPERLTDLSQPRSGWKLRRAKSQVLQGRRKAHVVCFRRPFRTDYLPASPQALRAWLMSGVASRQRGLRFGSILSMNLKLAGTTRCDVPARKAGGTNLARRTRRNARCAAGTRRGRRSAPSLPGSWSMGSSKRNRELQSAFDVEDLPASPTPACIARRPCYLRRA